MASFIADNSVSNILFIYKWGECSLMKNYFRNYISDDIIEKKLKITMRSLSTAGCYKETLDVPPAAKAEIKYILQNLEYLLIRGEFDDTGDDTAYLDNVTYE